MDKIVSSPKTLPAQEKSKSTVVVLQGEGTGAACTYMLMHHTVSLPSLRTCHVLPTKKGEKGEREGKKVRRKYIVARCTDRNKSLRTVLPA